MIKKRLDDSNNDDLEAEPLTMEQMQEIGKEIDSLKEKLKTLEDGFNHQSDLFKLFKESGDLIDKYDQTMKALLQEGP